MRFDQMQSMATAPNSFLPTNYRLGDKAFDVVRQWVDWFITGELADEELLIARSYLMES